MSTIDPALPPLPPVRAEYERTLDTLPDAERAVPAPLASCRRCGMVSAQRHRTRADCRVEIVARIVANDLLVPTFGATLAAFVQGIESGELLVKTGISLSVLLRGYALGVFFAFALTSLAVSTRIGRDLLAMLTSMFNPLPSIALLPIALLWFAGTGSLLFVLVHAVLWPLALSMSGLRGRAGHAEDGGRNYGLTGLRQIALILVPAALPSILSGLRVGWAFAWRTLIAAELVFGASAGQGGPAGTSSRTATSCIRIACSPASRPSS